jgi:hypothetical protein
VMKRIWAKKASLEDKDLKDNFIGRNGTGRMWFEPGRMSYVLSEDHSTMTTTRTIFIDCVQILLNSVLYKEEGVGNDEEQNPFHRAFATEWTNRMDEIILTNESLRRMRTHFRTFALAKIMYLRGDWVRLDKVDVDLLDTGYPVRMSNIVPYKYPPLFRVVNVNLPSIKKQLKFVIAGGVTVKHQKTKESDATTWSDGGLAGKRATEESR